MRVWQGAGYDRVRVRGQVGDQFGAVVVGVELVGDAGAGVGGAAGQRGRVVGRGTDADRAGRRDDGRDARSVRADGQRLGGAAAADRTGVVVVAGRSEERRVGEGGS